ncbi:cbb3-type cytochrome c oxidase subunit I [Spiribacter sp. 221]|uniref:cbb3-type cytochrome c oxidase subunit I n=1 Tax=Spiribacter onubensis TaxID=3122420 RepID=UPI00349FB933
MSLTIGSMMALSFVVSLIALAFLIWAVASRQFRMNQEDAELIFPGGEGGDHQPDDPTSFGFQEKAEPGEGTDTRHRKLIFALIGFGTFWLVFGSMFGVIASLKFNIPDWLSGSAPLTFGRVRTVHLNTVIYGWLSLTGIGVAMFLIPRIFKTHLRGVNFAWVGLVLWNIGVAAGAWAIATGWTDGMEWLEIPRPIDIILAAGGACFAIPLVMTALKRNVHHIYVTGWYYLAALVWFPVLFVLGNLPMHSGVQQATVNWWFAHNVLGLWLTPIGVGAAYYILPKIIGKPIYSYRLSLLGFWALALFYSQVGMHHIIGGPVPTWVVTLSVVQSVMMFVPVIAVAVNQHVLWATNLWAFKQSLPLRFVAFGAVMYTLASFQGSLEAVRAVNTVTHFTHYTVGHAHLGAYAFVSLVLFGTVYYLMPILTGRLWPAPRLISLHFWLVAIGFGIYFVSLTIGGWLQGLAMLDASRDWLESMQLTQPYLQGRTLGGTLMTIGHIIFAINLVSLLFASRREETPAATGAPATTAG